MSAAPGTRRRTDAPLLAQAARCDPPPHVVAHQPPATVHRVLVVGISGAGKTTLARRLATLLDLPYFELDALYHGAGWTERPEFEADVDALTSAQRWVTDGYGYPSVRELLWRRADTVVWLDVERRVAMARVLRRTLWHGLLRRELWNGNRESLLNAVRDPEHPVRWAWTQHAARRQLVAERVAGPESAHLTVVHLRTPAEVRRWWRQLRKEP